MTRKSFWTPTSGVPTIKGLLTFSVENAVSVGNGAARLYPPFAIAIVSVRASVGVAPTGASLIVDVNKDGTTIFTTQANRPTIAVSAFDSGEETPDVTVVATTEYLTVDVDQVGSTIAGSHLTTVIEYEVA